MDKRPQKKKVLKEIIWFLVKFNLLLIPFYAIIYFDIDFYYLQEMFAKSLGHMLSAIGHPNEVKGFLIYVGGLTIDISRDCLGWKSAYSLFALVMASPGEWKKKLKFLGLWVPTLIVFNVFRVLSTILIGLRFGVGYMGLFHDIIWQEVVIVVIVAIWYVWLRKAIKLNEEKHEN